MVTIASDFFFIQVMFTSPFLLPQTLYANNENKQIQTIHQSAIRMIQLRDKIVYMYMSLLYLTPNLIRM